MNKKSEIGAWIWLPVILAVAVAPLITVIHAYDCGLENNLWFSTGGVVYDFFLYYKSRLLMLAGVLAAVVLGLLILQREKGNLAKKKAWMPLIPVGVFLLFSFLSALFSEDRQAAFFGGYEQFEGLLVLVTYVLCFSLVYCYVNNEKSAKIILYALLVGALLVGTLGVFQALGYDYDYMNSSWGKALVTSIEAATRKFNFKLNFEEGIAYSTLYNPNYIGSYVGLVLPVTASFIVWKGNVYGKIFAGIATLFQVIMLIASRSLAGIIGVICAVITAVVFLVPYIIKKRLLTVIAGGVLAVGIVAFIIACPNIFENLFADNYAGKASITSITTEKNTFRLETASGRIITGTVENGTGIYQAVLQDDLGNTVIGSYENIQFSPSQMTLQNPEQTVDTLEIKADGKTFSLVMVGKNIRYVNLFGRVDALREIDKFGFEGHYGFATKRGYIWSRTLPLLKDTLFLGKGADNFTHAFPNDDYVGKIYMNYDGAVVTKPHNMYMQIWVQDGMFACLALIVLFFLYVVDTFRTCFGGGEKSFRQKTAIAILCGVVGYMVAGLANDSTICVAPVFWVLFGLGFAMNVLERVKERARV
ncbi:MAG: O-antigen ligase family protein [Lachnospiraceae bacterium]|nr:O-antigen ligase family protein [Lachnospiraceae bacterium]